MKDFKLITMSLLMLYFAPSIVAMEKPEPALIGAVKNSLGSDYMALLILEGENPLATDSSGKTFFDYAKPEDIAKILRHLNTQFHTLTDEVTKTEGEAEGAEVKKKALSKKNLLVFAITEGIDPEGLLIGKSNKGLAEIFSDFKSTIDYLRKELKEKAETPAEKMKGILVAGVPIPVPQQIKGMPEVPAKEAVALPLPPMAVLPTAVPARPKISAPQKPSRPAPRVPYAPSKAQEEVISLKLPLKVTTEKIVISQISKGEQLSPKLKQMVVDLLARLNFDKPERVFQNPNAMTKQGNSALLQIAERDFLNEETMNVAQALLALGAKINFSNPSNGNTPLLAALTANPYRNWQAAPAMAEWLIKKGANVNAKRLNGETVDFLAQALRDPEMKKSILNLIQEKIRRA